MPKACIYVPGTILRALLDSPTEAPEQPNGVDIVNTVLQMKKLSNWKVK